MRSHPPDLIGLAVLSPRYAGPTRKEGWNAGRALPLPLVTATRGSKAVRRLNHVLAVFFAVAFCFAGRFVWVRGREVWRVRQNHLLVRAIADHRSSLALAALAEGADANARTVL